MGKDDGFQDYRRMPVPDEAFEQSEYVENTASVRNSYHAVPRNGYEQNHQESNRRVREDFEDEMILNIPDQLEQQSTSNPKKSQAKTPTNDSGTLARTAPNPTGRVVTDLPKYLYIPAVGANRLKPLSEAPDDVALSLTNKLKAIFQTDIRGASIMTDPKNENTYIKSKQCVSST
jgi:hypothetical protein